MRNLIPLAVVGVVVVGCGAGVEEPSAEMVAATWTGRSGYLFEGVGSIGDDGFQVRTEPGNLGGTVSGLCGGSESVELDEMGNGAYVWSGSLECAPRAFGFCESVRVRFLSVAAYPSADGLTVFAGGEGVGCGETRALSFSFVGSR